MREWKKAGGGGGGVWSCRCHGNYCRLMGADWPRLPQVPRGDKHRRDSGFQVQRDAGRSWKVKGAHGTVYLFGSVHVMKPEVDWETVKVKQAFDASDTVYVEVANLDDQTAALPLAAQFGMDMAHPLSTKISKDDVALLDGAVKSMGLPGEAMLEPMQPWLVSMTVSLLPMMKAGYDPAGGVDVVLLGQARKAGKKIEGFETMEQQLHFVADEPQEMQVAEAA